MINAPTSETNATFHKNSNTRQMCRRGGAVGSCSGVTGGLPLVSGAPCADHPALDTPDQTQTMQLHFFAIPLPCPD